MSTRKGRSKSERWVGDEGGGRREGNVANWSRRIAPLLSPLPFPSPLANIHKPSHLRPSNKTKQTHHITYNSTIYLDTIFLYKARKSLSSTASTPDFFQCSSEEVGVVEEWNMSPKSKRKELCGKREEMRAGGGYKRGSKGDIKHNSLGINNSSQ